MPPWLSNEMVLELNDRSIEIGLQNKRSLLLGSLPTKYTAGLPAMGNDADQLLSDIQKLNDSPMVIGDVIPLENWLTNASYHSAIYPEHQIFFNMLSNQVANASQEKGRRSLDLLKADSFPNLVSIQERIIFTNDLLPVSFLGNAQAISRSVARLIVPRFENGQPATNLGGTQVKYFGTGWLIGAAHLITNYHVINARESSEPDATAIDLRLQSEQLIVEFDYDDEHSKTETNEVGALSHYNKTLDYAVVRLSGMTNRIPLPLWSHEVSLPSKRVLPVNIVQHPGGATKQIGIRNNLSAEITDHEIAYFTDTKGGSSGSPVCNDFWQVIALHKAATRTFGEIDFQGRKTEWVNIGTRIDKIIEDLRSNQNTLWNEIEANY